MYLVVLVLKQNYTKLDCYNKFHTIKIHDVYTELFEKYGTLQFFLLNILNTDFYILM